MLSNLLAIVAGTGDKAGNFYFDNFGEAVIYALIGFCVVFFGIVIIIGVIWLVGFIMKKTNGLAFLTAKKDKKSDKKSNKPKVVNVPEITELPVDRETTSNEIPDEVKAAIIAAIMAYYQEKQEKCSFTVKRIKRI